MSREVPDGYENERLWEVAGRHGRLRMVTGGYVWVSQATRLERLEFEYSISSYGAGTAGIWVSQARIWVSPATGLERLESEYLKLESEYLQLQGWNGWNLSISS